MLSILALCLFATPQTPHFDDSRQVLWQRSLADALALSQAQHRPLLVAINADGESGSERIVREQYRDPQWVASARPFVCVIGSIFRHNPRDYDDAGRRIPCPRLGEITCGEHIAMEPLVHARYFAGKPIQLFGETVERISPRHALIETDGTTSLDLYLLFDMRELGQALGDAAAKVKPFDATEALTWPSQRARLAFEDSLAGARDPLGAVRERYQPLVRDNTPTNHQFFGTSDPGWIDALRRLLSNAKEFENRAAVEWIADFSAQTQAEVAAAMRAVVVGDLSPAADPSLARWIEPMAKLGKDAPGMRTLVLSYLSLGSIAGGADSERSRALAGLHAMLGEQSAHEVAAALDAADASFDAPEFLRCVSATRSPSSGANKPPPEVLPDAAELERALEDLDAQRKGDGATPLASEAFGRAALALARRRIQDGRTNGVDMLLQDASVALAEASKAKPDDVGLLLERARAANYTARFDEQEQLAAQALKTLNFQWKSPPATFDDPTVEGLRWLGDACARELAARAKSDPADEAVGILRGGRALALAAATSESDATDWLSVASFFGALGRAREHVSLCEEGLRRFPDDAALRTELSNTLWSLGRPDLLVARYEDLARMHASSAASAWYAGYALVLHAESLRRCEDPDGSVAAYERAAEHFRRAIELEPNFRDSSTHYLALSAMGRGFAHLLADRREEAARCVVDAAKVRPAIVSVRDGLDREGVDLIDGVLEWRASGASSVDALAWLADLTRVDPANAFWGRAISDAALREGLRADGRHDAALGDRYIQTAIEAARRVFAIDTSPEDAHALAQAATIQAERLLARGGDAPGIGKLLADAASALGLESPAADATPAVLAELAARLRAQLGEARPIARPGR